MRSRESSPSVNISTINAKKRFRIKQVEKNVLLNSLCNYNKWKYRTFIVGWLNIIVYFWIKNILDMLIDISQIRIFNFSTF